MRIHYSKTASPGGADLAKAVQLLLEVKELVRLAKGMADAVAAGGATPALLEASEEFNVDTGQGQALYTAIANLNANLSSVTDAALAELNRG